MAAPLGKQALTAIVPVRAESSALIGPGVEARAVTLRTQLAAVESLHFARFALVDADGASGGTAVQLVFATTFDGVAETHLDELWRHAGGELAAVFSHCEGWDGAATRESFGRFLAVHARPAAALFSAHGELSAPRIRADAALRRDLSAWMNANAHELRRLPPVEIVRRAQASVAIGPPTNGAAPAPLTAPVPAARSVLTLTDWLALALTFVRSFVLDACEFVGALWHDTSAPVRSDWVRGAEGEGGHSFSHLATLKAGSFRRAALRLALRVTAKLTRAASSSGKLFEVDAVHAARVMLLDDGRLLLLADFDASLETALADFGERASAALAMIWSHTRGFPQGLGFMPRRARDSAALRAWARGGELATPLAYSAYPRLGAREVRENAEIRGLLTSALDEARARRLLSLVRD